MHSYPQACPSLFTALDWYRHCTVIRASSQLDLITSISSSLFALAADLPQGTVGLVCLSCLLPPLAVSSCGSKSSQAKRAL